MYSDTEKKNDKRLNSKTVIEKGWRVKPIDEHWKDMLIS